VCFLDIVFCMCFVFSIIFYFVLFILFNDSSTITPIVLVDSLQSFLLILLMLLNASRQNVWTLTSKSFYILFSYHP
jgi:hypothetical protein